MKIMKRLRDLEMKLIKGKKIKFIFSFFFFFICCQQPIENKISSWEIDHVSFLDGSISNVPDEERYTMVISKKQIKKLYCR